MSKNKNIVNFRFSGLLGIILVIGKLTGKLDWPWFWVLTPYWLPLAILLGAAALFIVLAAVQAWSES